MLKTKLIRGEKEVEVNVMRIKGYSVKVAEFFEDKVDITFHCGNSISYDYNQSVADITKGKFTRKITGEELARFLSEVSDILATENNKQEVEEASGRPKEFDWKTTPGAMPFFYNIYHPEVAVKLPREFAMLQGLIKNPPYIDIAKFRNGELVELVLEDKRYALHKDNGIWKINGNYFEVKEYYDSILKLVESIKKYITECMY